MSEGDFDIDVVEASVEIDVSEFDGELREALLAEIQEPGQKAIAWYAECIEKCRPEARTKNSERENVAFYLLLHAKFLAFLRYAIHHPDLDATEGCVEDMEGDLDFDYTGWPLENRIRLIYLHWCVYMRHVARTDTPTEALDTTPLPFELGEYPWPLDGDSASSE